MNLRMSASSEARTILERLQEQSKPKTTGETRFVASAALPAPRFLPGAAAR